jgi:hypothetical protein
LEMQMAEVMKKLEQAGEEGRVQEAEDMTLQVEKLKFDLEKAKEEANPYIRAEKRMEICEICGAFLVMNDTQRRLEAHYEGRQHLGFIKVREKCAELKLKYQGQNYGQNRSSMEHKRQRSPSPYRPKNSSWSGDRNEERPREERRRRESYEDEKRGSKRHSPERSAPRKHSDADRRSRDYDKGGRRDSYDRPSSSRRN